MECKYQKVKRKKNRGTTAGAVFHFLNSQEPHQNDTKKCTELKRKSPSQLEHAIVTRV